MPNTQTRRRSAGTKAEQDKAQREAKAAEQAAAAEQNGEPDEAPESELAAQAQRPSTDQPDEQPEAEAAAASEPEMEIGSVVSVPTINRSSNKASVWTDRLNDAAEKLEAAGFPEGSAVPVLSCATPRTAANTANAQRNKLKEGKIGGLLPGTFTIITRGRTILVGFKKA